MKKKFLTIGFYAATLILSSCTKDGVNIAPVTPPLITPVSGGNSGPLQLYALDSARVIKMTQTGANPTIVLNKQVNNNSYIGDFSLSSDGTKCAYVEDQAGGIVPNFVKTVKLRTSKTDGTGDTELFSVLNANSGSYISAVRYCSDGKIFFVYIEYTASGNAFVISYKTINADGTGLTTSQPFGGFIDDITNDRRFSISTLASPPTPGNPTLYRVQILDKTMDNGAGGLYTGETLPVAITAVGRGSFTADGKFAIIPYREANDIKIKIFDMATKVATVKTVLTGLTTPNVDFDLQIASDGVRAVLTTGSLGLPKTRSYIFNAVSGVVSAPFDNVNNAVFSVYAY